MLTTPFHYISQLVNRLLGLPFMLRLARKYPKLFRFVQERFNPKHFFGLPFTIVLLLTWANIALLSEVCENIVNSKGMKAIDSFVSNAFFQLRTPILTKAFFYFTQLGTVTGMFIVTVTAALLLILKKKWYYLLALFISVLGNGTSVYLIKNFFHRERPENIAYYTLSTFSFPSGHAAGSVALEGLLCCFLIIETNNQKAQFLWILAGLCYIILIGFSRIYLGLHFLSDVVGGYSVGFLWLLFAIVCMEYAAYKKPGEQAL